MSYDKEVRATVALLGGSMATMGAGPLGLSMGATSGQEQVKRRVSSRSKTFAKKDDKRNSALGFFSLFGRKTSEKTRSAVFHSDDALDGDRRSITSSNPSLTSIAAPLPYPVHPVVSKSYSSSGLLLLATPVNSVHIVYATELSWAEEVHVTAEREDEQAPPYYDDNDVVDHGIGDSDSSLCVPEFSPRQYSLIRRQCIRRKETGSRRARGKHRRFTHCGLPADQPELALSNSGLLQMTSGSAFKFFRGISAPITSSGAETSSDSDDDSSTIVSNDSRRDVVDREQLPTLIIEIKAISAPCPIHRNMSQYSLNITCLFLCQVFE